MMGTKVRVFGRLPFYPVERGHQAVPIDEIVLQRQDAEEEVSIRVHD